MEKKKRGGKFRKGEKNIWFWVLTMDVRRI